MPVIGVRQLSRATRGVIEQLLEDGQPVVVTRDGRAVAVLSRVAEEQVSALALSVVPDLIRRRKMAVGDITAGRGRPVTELAAEFDEESQIIFPWERTDVAMSDFTQRLAAASVAAAEVPEQIRSDVRIQGVNAELVNAYIKDVLPSIFRRVKAVNEKVAADVSGDEEALDPGRYLDVLQHIAELQIELVRPHTQRPVSTRDA